MLRSFADRKTARAARMRRIVHERQSLLSLSAIRHCLGLWLRVCVFFTLAASWPLPAQEVRWNELNVQVDHLYQQGKYAEAIPLAQESQRIAEAAFGSEHPNTAKSVNNLAELYYYQGRYAEAEPLFQRALAIKEKALGPDHPDVATSLNNLALLYKEQGRYAAAEPLFERALNIDEKALGQAHPNVATDLNNLAVLYDEQGRHAAAEPLYRRALAIREKVLGLDHPAVAASLNNLALSYKEQGRYAAAEPLYKRALAIRQKALGPDDPAVATTLNNLAFLYFKQGRYADAEPLCMRALAIDEKALGTEHPDVATDLNNLALLYKEQEHYAEAEPLYKHALAILEKALGPDHPDVATSLNNLAFLYYKQGRYADAEPLYMRALAIDEKALGPEHADVATDLNNLALLYKEQGRSAEAEPFFQRALAINEKALGPDHPDAATSLNNLAIPTIQVFDAKTGRTLLVLNETKPVVSVVFSPDGGRLASYAQDLRITIWDATNGQALLVIPTEQELIGSIVFSPDGHFVVGASSRSVIMWDTRSGHMIREFYSPPPTALAFAPDGRTLAVATRDSPIRLFDVAMGREIRKLSARGGTIYCLAFSRDGRLLASGNDHNTANIWNLSGQSEPSELAGHSGSVLAVAFSPDSRLLATGSADHTCKIWDINTRAEIGTLRGHTLSVISLAFDPTGRTLVTGSEDHTSKVWETSNWREVQTISSMQGVVSSLALSPDGTKIASGTTLAHIEESSAYILAIGISRYNHPEFDLRYAAGDATALAQAFREGGKGSFARVSSSLMTDEGASRLRIIAAIQSVVNEARPSDTFIFYFAGHGVAADGEYFLLPSDVELGDKSDLTAVRRMGISSKELKIWLGKITAKQQLVLLDTATSASAFEALDSRFEQQNKELTELLGRNMVIIASGGNAEFSIEGGQFPHGLLTYALLEGLAGKADNSSDGTITAHQLASFTSNRIEVLTNGKTSGLDSFIGEDFPIARTQVPTARHTSFHTAAHLQQAAYAFRSPLEVPFAILEAINQDPQSSTSSPNSELRGFSSEPARVSPTPNLPPRKDYAVLFGTDDYDDSSHWHHLTNPLDDVKAIAEDLQKNYGFDVSVVPNPTQDEILGTLKGYIKRQYGPEDQLLIFFAGHGAYDEDFSEGFVVARDSQANDENRRSYISYSELRTILDNMRVQHVLLVLDTCYGGTFDPKWTPGQLRGDDVYAGISREQFVHRKLQYKTRRYITSGGKEYVSDGRPGQHSPFVRAFLEALRTYGGSNGFLTIDGVYEHMQRLQPEPHRNEFGRNEPGSDFLFVIKDH